ncbi:MAG: hypothetical protein WC058_05535 [Phycisphaeraceae bacterium]
MIPNWLWLVVLTLVESLSARRDARLRFLRQQLELALVRIPGNRVRVAQPLRAQGGLNRPLSPT